MSFKLIRWITTIALILAVFVVMLGAYTRLTDAGLGCPDWPGCYGKMVLPNEQDASRHSAQAMYPDIPIESRKAWTEMLHRYAAGTLGTLIIIIAVIACCGPKAMRLSGMFSVFLISLVIFQALLGMWTVTLKLLPVVVMGHLLGGMSLTALLTLYRWHMSALGSYHGMARRWHLGALIALIIVVFQIALGGWVSANYAGLACLGFPTCNQQWIPHFDWSRAFNLLSPIGSNYQGGLLDLSARVTIQWVHRLWGVIVTVGVLFFTLSLGAATRVKVIRVFAFLTGLLVVFQMLLGIMNVVYMLPLPIAVLHNGIALLLLMSIVSLCYLTSRRDA